MEGDAHSYVPSFLSSPDLTWHVIGSCQRVICKINRLWLQWILSFNIHWALGRHLTSPISMKLGKWVPVMFWVVLITCCRALLSWAIHIPYQYVPSQDVFYCSLLCLLWHTWTYKHFCNNCSGTVIDDVARRVVRRTWQRQLLSVWCWWYGWQPQVKVRLPVCVVVRLIATTSFIVLW